MRLTSNQPIEVRQYKSPDSTVTSKEDHLHTCVEVRSKRELDALDVALTVAPAESGGARSEAK
jgi:hypothetical protein